MRTVITTKSGSVYQIDNDHNVFRNSESPVFNQDTGQYVVVNGYIGRLVGEPGDLVTGNKAKIQGLDGFVFTTNDIQNIERHYTAEELSVIYGDKLLSEPVEPVKEPMEAGIER